MIKRICTKCGSRWLVGSDRIKECPNCDGDLVDEPISNADRIRAMTDEELVKLFTLRDTYCCPAAKGDIEACRAYWSCETCFSDWLKREAEE